MGAVLYNILHPTVDNDDDNRSEDAQVNGIGFYRTVDGGTEGLLIDRIPMPANPQISASAPGDIGDVTGVSNTLAMQFTLVAENFDFYFTFANSWYAFTTMAELGAILAGANQDPTNYVGVPIEGIGHRTTYGTSTEGEFTTFMWEMDMENGNTPGTDSMAWGTYNWEGVNLYYLTSAGTVMNFTMRQKFADASVGFHSFYLLNNSNPHLNMYVPAGYQGNDPSQSLFSLQSTKEVLCTQHFELAQPTQFVPGIWHPETEIVTTLDTNTDVSSRTYPDAGMINSEDSSGRRATSRWEIDQFDIEQTWHWMYEDRTADNALGVPVEEDNDVPPPGSIASVFQEHMFLAGDPDNPHYLYWSKRFKPEAWPVDNFVEIGTANDPIRAHMPVAGVLGVFTTQTKYRVTGNDTAGFVHDEAVSHRGAPAPRSVVPTDKGVFFVARDGVFTTNFLGPDTKISDAIDPIFLGETKNGYDPINWDAVDQIAAGFYKNKFYFSYPSGSNTINDMTAVFSVDAQSWTFWNVGFASYFAERDTDIFLAGGVDSLVYKIEESDTKSHNGSDISFELQTRDFTGSAQTTRNLFTYFKVDAECGSTSLTAQFYVDDTLIATRTITGSRTCALLRLPENTFGNKWRVRITGSGQQRFAVYGVTSIFIPLMAAA